MFIYSLRLNDAIVWIINNQFGRRNLPVHVRIKLALRLHDVISKKAKENQKLSEGRGQKGFQNSDNLNAKLRTDKELGKIAGVSHNTIFPGKRQFIHNENKTA